MLNNDIFLKGVITLKSRAYGVKWNKAFLDEWSSKSNSVVVSEKIPNMYGMYIITKNPYDDYIHSRIRMYPLNEIKIVVNQWQRTLAIVAIAGAILVVVLILSLIAKILSRT